MSTARNFDRVQALDCRAPASPSNFQPVANSPEEFAAYLRKESEIYAKAIRISGAKIE